MSVFRRSARIYDALYSSMKDYRAEALRVAETLEQEGVPPGSHLLDVACGTGLHLEHLRRTYEVEGLDRSPAMLEVAQDRLPGVPLHTGDMETFRLEATFDAVLCLFSSIGYVRSPEAYARTVANLARHLRPGGVLLVEPWFTPEAWNTGHLHLLTVDEPELKVARSCISQREDRLAVLDMHHLVATPEGVEHFVENHRLLLLTIDEQIEGFRSAGLEVHRDDEGPSGRGLLRGRKPAAG